MPDKDNLLAAIDAYSSSTYGSDEQGGELSRQRSLALDAYQLKNIEPAPEGRSQVVDGSVFETIQYILPSLMKIFAGGEDVVEFEPQNADDEEAAQQESAVLNHIVTQKNNWYLTCLQWFTDALLTKNAYCMASMEKKIVPEIERYERQSEEQITLLLDDDVEVVGSKQYDDPDDEGNLIHPQTGQPVQDEQQALEALMIYESQGMEPQLQFRQLFDVELKRTKEKQQLRFDVLPPERVLVGTDTPDFTLNECNYFEFFEWLTISDLRKCGYDVEDDIADDAGGETSTESYARDEILEAVYGAGNVDDFGNPDPAMRMVKVRTIWIRCDYDEDGIAELQKVVLVGREILAHEPASRIPVACIVPFINTHRHIGMSVADLVFDIWRIRTAMLRSGLDSLYLATNPRHYVNENAMSENTIRDLLVSRPGGIVRGSGMPAETVSPLQTENTFPYAMQGLQHMDTVIESRTGVSKMFAGIDQSAMAGNNSYNAIGQLSTMAAQRVEQIARIFANGVERLFSLAHELVIKSGHSSQTLRLRGEWVDFDPSQWRTGREMRIVAPFAAGNKDSLVQRLMIHLQVHQQAAAAGHPMVQVDDTYELAKMLAAATDVSGDKIYTDPRTVQPPEPGPDPTMIALEIENKKADNAATEAQIDAETDKYKTDVAAEIDRYKADLNAQVQLALAQIKAGQAVDLEKTRAMLKDAPLEVGQALNESKIIKDAVESAMNEIKAAVDSYQRSSTAPIKVVRDERGKIIGKEVDGQFVPLEDVK